MCLLKYYDAYTGLGMNIIPLLPRSKKPFRDRWNERNEDLRYYFRDDSLNMGVVLGNIVDVEGDTPEANRKLASLIGNIPHPRYQSQKSIHHLFLNPDKDLTRFVVDDIEFRAHRHQSCLPPSIHESGQSYQWLKGSTFPIAAMPDELREYYFAEKQKRNARTKRRSNLKPGHIMVNCFECKKEVFLHSKRHQLEIVAFRNRNLRWSCHGCRQIDVREECRYIRKIST